MSASINANGIEGLELFFETMPDIASRAMSIAINDTARGTALDAARRNILDQVNFPTGYLDDDDKLGISQFSSPDNLEAKITARQRPTSLLRFADIPNVAVKQTKNAPPVNVTVKPGDVRAIPRAFVVQLRNGNMGLAIRLRPGEVLHNRYDKNAIQIFPNVYLLYGPSVDQVFQTVREDIKPEVTAELEKQFTRQFNRLLNDG